MNEERILLGTQWRAVAAALSIQFIGPFFLPLPNGKQREFAGLLPQFGGGRGMLIDSEYDNESFKVALAAGYGVSTMQAETHHLPVNPKDYTDCLVDWGWSVENELAPKWYQSAD